MRALIADTNLSRIERVETTLRLHWPGVTCDRVADGWKVVEAALGAEVDLIVLDPHLPYTAGGQLLRDLRRVSPVALVLLLHRESEADRIELGKLGSIDYVVDTFCPLEFLARTEAALYLATLDDRGVRAGERRLRWSDGYLSIDFTRSRAWISRAPLTLAPAEFRLLTHLVLNAGRVVSDRALLSLVLGKAGAGATECLEVFLRRIREQIEPDPDEPRYLVAERGLGYRFVRATPLGRTRWYVLPGPEASPAEPEPAEEVAQVLQFARRQDHVLTLLD